MRGDLDSAGRTIQRLKGARAVSGARIVVPPPASPVAATAAASGGAADAAQQRSAAKSVASGSAAAGWCTSDPRRLRELRIGHRLHLNLQVT